MAVATIAIAALRMPPITVGIASGSSTLRMIAELAHPHAARGVDGGAVDLADADVGVGEDRRDAEHRQGASVTLLRPTPISAATSAITASSGIARPALPRPTASSSPLPRWPR